MGTDLRLLASLCLVGASYLMGQALSRKTLTRLEDVYGFAQALTMLATEVGYTATPLPQALERASHAVGGHVGEMFDSVVRSLESGQATVDEAWRTALALGETRLGMPLDDLKFVSDLGPTLGRSDRLDQVAHLGRVAKQLDTLAERLAPECERNARLSRTLGLLGGLAAAIVVL